MTDPRPLPRRRFFDARLRRDPAPIRVLKRVVVAFLCVHVTLASISGYRAIVQLYRVDLRVPPGPLGPGASVEARIVTSGRTTASLTLELVQGGQVDTLGVRRVPANWDGVYDPLPRSTTLAVTLSAAPLARFRRGPAVVRATARGASQWLRVPPPEVREVAVAIRRE